MIKLAPEGYPFILGSFLATIIVSMFLIWSWKSGSYNLSFYFLLCTTCFFLLVAVFMVFFFRDPDRRVPKGEGLFVSPADGKIILIRETYEQNYLKCQSKEVSIFMSPLDVHVNCAPCDGRVSIVKYSPGKFMAAYKEDSSVKNENITMVLENENENVKVLVKQIAGFIARRAVCRVNVGDLLKRGDRYGMIKFGSRLDVYMPVNTKIKVGMGDRVRAGETVIGELQR